MGVLLVFQFLLWLQEDKEATILMITMEYRSVYISCVCLWQSYSMTQGQVEIRLQFEMRF